MKQGWEIKKLKDVTSLITDGDWIESRHQSEAGIRLIQTGNVGNGFFKAKDDKPHFISEETFDVLGCTEIFEGDCLVSRLPDPVGRACLIPEMDCRMITAVDCSIIRFNEILVPDFFIYYSQSSKYQNEISNKTTGTTRKRVSRKNLEMIPIPVPPIAEQEKIVAELDCLSGIIEKKKQQLKELDNLARSIFYEMFGDPDNSRFPKLPLQNLSEYKLSYGSGASAVEFDEDVRYVRITDIQEDGKLDSNAMSPSVCEEKYLLQDGDILFARSGATVGKTYHYRNTDGKAIYAGYLIRFIPNQKLVLPEYVFYYTRSDYYHAFIRKSAQAVAQPNINAKQYGDLIVCVPPLALQQDFASKIETIEKQKELIVQSIKATETLFNSRMDYYFN